MAQTTVSKMIFIGNLPIIDNDESNWDTDNASALIGTYTSFAGGLELVNVTNNDQNSDGIIEDDEGGRNDTVSYTHSQGSYTGKVDASVSFRATITEEDGSSRVIDVLVIQMPNGDTFVTELLQNGRMDNLTIRSIELTTPLTTNAAGYSIYNSAEGTTVCFGFGTRILTSRGPRAVERLRRGDLVLTRDHGYQPILWTGHFVGSARQGAPPVVVPRGCLGPGQPSGDLELTAQHRVLVQSEIARQMFSSGEVLVPARSLVGFRGARFLQGRRAFACAHILCARHEVVLAEDAWCETLLPLAATRLLGSVAASGGPARRILTTRQAQQLLARHRATGASLQGAAS